MPDDWELLGLDYSKLTGTTIIGGVGGFATFHTAKSFFSFVISDIAVYIYSVEVAVAPPDTHYREIPSLLGRDILDKWKMFYYPRGGTLEFEILQSDLEMAIPH